MQKTVFFAVLLGVLLAPAWVRADELFDDRAQAVRYSPQALLDLIWQPTAAASDAALAAIAPAAGEAHETVAAEEGGGHAAKSSKGGKDLTGKPPIPTVMIGGEAVITRDMKRARDISASTPAGLKSPATTALLERRAQIKTFAHAPVRGAANAPIRVVLFEDLSCTQCMPYVAKVEAALLPYVSNTRVVFVNAPTLKFQDTNQPAFYGKIAARMGVFWKYREMLVNDPPANAGALFDALVASGVTLAEARSMMLNDARRFYRELDGDALLAQAFRVNKPPVVYVNGIRVGEGGVPLEQLDNVLKYVQQRIDLHLGEPPQ